MIYIVAYRKGGKIIITLILLRGQKIELHGALLLFLGWIQDMHVVEAYGGIKPGFPMV